jgi:hypothetical protein
LSTYHKAYSFDYARFVDELAPILWAALATGDVVELARFVDDHQPTLVHPREREPLTVDWRTQLPALTAQRIGSFALTAYYDPNQNLGLSNEWADIGNIVGRAVDADYDTFFFGTDFGPPSNVFDPGTMGSYFRDWPTLHRQRQQLAGLMTGPSRTDPIAVFDAMLRPADETLRGLYVTFS